MLVGGGSGGHVTPLKTVARKLLDTHTNVQLSVITDKQFSALARKIFSDFDERMSVETIFAGKFRRYSGKNLFWYLLHPVVILLNIRDVFYLLIGIMQSIKIIRVFKPTVVFAKGGFVGVPVGVAAKLYRIPLVIHESDSHAGLANRLLARWAHAIAVSAQVGSYRFDRLKTYNTGIPISERYKPVSVKQQRKLKVRLGFSLEKPLLLIMGGGTGAEALNLVIANEAKRLLAEFQIIHFTGVGKSSIVGETLAGLEIESEKLKDYHMIEFSDELVQYLQASDVAVSRAGASAIREVVAVEKPLVLVAGKQLSGGHQVVNAEQAVEQGVAISLDEDRLAENGELLTKCLIDGMGEDVFKGITKNMKKYNKSLPDATESIIELLNLSARYESETEFISARE